MKKILITGAGGYIGSTLVRLLLTRGYVVIAVDRFYFGFEVLKDVATHPNLRIHKVDARQLDSGLLQDVYAVFDLVALSNDPSGDLDPNLTREINYESRLRTANLAKESRVPRYILMSSCSVYGAGSSLNLDESSPVNPLTHYARASLRAEQDILPLSSESFCVSIMRNATVFGLSNRMRFDLVVNLMVVSVFEERKITIMGGGDQYRPLVHVKDVCESGLKMLEASSEIVERQIINIGLGNFQIIELAYLIREILGNDIEISKVNDDLDKRTYNVNFAKMKNILNYEPKYDIRYGVEEIYDALVKRKTVRSDRTSTVGWYRRLKEAETLFKELSVDGKII